VLGTAVAISAYEEGGALAVGLVGFRFAPAALASLATALLGDRFGRRRVLTATALVRTGVAIAVAVAIAVGLPFAVVLALVWIDAAAGSAYRPAQAGLLPRWSRRRASSRPRRSCRPTPRRPSRCSARSRAGC
jgi:MFS family permease